MKLLRKSYRKILLLSLFGLMGLFTGLQKSYAVANPLLRMAKRFSKKYYAPFCHRKLHGRYVGCTWASKRWYLYGCYRGYYRGGLTGYNDSRVTWPYIPYAAFSAQATEAAHKAAETKKDVSTKKLNEMQFSPSDYEFAFLSKHVYTSKAALEEAQKKNKSQKEAKEQPTLEIEVNKKRETLAGWVIDKIFTHPDYSSYQSVLYRNESKNQLILAYQGTNIQDLENFVRDFGGTNFPGIVGNEATIGQQRIIDEVLEEAIMLAKEEKYTLSLTGHSLGGWLAQIASFIAHDRYLEKFSYAHRMLKTVVFDSPGAQEMLEKLNHNVKPLDLNHLDITNYVSIPNMVNTLNTHLLTSLYQVVVVDREFSKIPVKYDIESHSMDNFVAVFDKHSGAFKSSEVEKIREMKSWPSQKTDGGMLKWICDRLSDPQPSEGDLGTFYLEYVKKYAIEKEGYQPYRIHRRHIPPYDYDFLLGKKDDKDRYIKVLKDNTTWAQYLTIDQENKDYLILAEEAKSDISDIRYALDELHGIAIKHPDLAKQSKEMERGVVSKRLNFVMAPAKALFFVGRTKEMESLAPYFEEKDKHVVLPPITGFGGLGKTQLVHQLIEKYEDNYDHIVWINAATAQDIETSYLQIAKGLEIELKLDQDPSIAIKNVIEKVQKKLESKHVLYVFDDAPDLITIHPYLKKGHVLITSRNNAPVDWEAEYCDAPLALEPFSEEDALQLAKAMGENTEDPDLIKLIDLLPKYPLVLRQLLSVMAARKYTPVAFLHKMEQNTALIQQLNTKPQKLAYKASIFEITKIALDDLQNTEKGKALLHLVEQLACLDAQPIPLSFVLLALGKEGAEDQTRDILGDLERNGLIRWDEQNVYIHGLIQTVIGEHYPLPPEQLETLVDRYVAYDIDKVVASKLSFPPNLESQMLPHGEKILKYVEDKRGEDIYTAMCYLKLSELYHQQGNYQNALTLGKKALKIYEQHYGANHPETAITMGNLGTVLYHLGDYASAKTHFEKALNINEQYYGHNHPNTASTMGNLGTVLSDQGDYPPAKAYYEKALVINEQHYGPNHPNTAGTMNNLGTVLYSQGDYASAKTHFEKALNITAPHYGHNHPETAITMGNLGNVLLKQGDYTSAKTHFEKALKIKEQHYGPTHPSTASTIANLSIVLRHQGHYAEAKQYYEKVLHIKTQHYGPDHPETASTMGNLGNVLRNLGDYAQAKQYYEKTLRLHEKHYGVDHPTTAITMENLGTVLANQGDYASAKKHYEKALKIQEQHYGPNHPSTATTMGNLGNLFKDLGQYEKARGYYEKTIAIFTRHYGPNHAMTKKVKRLLTNLEEQVASHNNKHDTQE